MRIYPSENSVPSLILITVCFPSGGILLLLVWQLIVIHQVGDTPDNSDYFLGYPIGDIWCK
jgi:hypothetical protein